MGYANQLGRRAKDPHTAASLVAAAALLFTAVWVLAAIMTASIGGTPTDRSTVVAFFLFVTPANAYVVTRLVWGRFITPRRRLSYRRAALVGGGTGLVSYATLSAMVFLAHAGIRTFRGEVVTGFVGDPVTLITLPLDVVMYAFVGSLFGIYLTAGIPIVLTVGVAIGLVHLHVSQDNHETVSGLHRQ